MLHVLFFHCIVPVGLSLWLALGRPPSVVHLIFRLMWIAVFVLTLAVAGAGWTWIGMWGRHAVMWIGLCGVLVGFGRAAYKRIPLVAFTTWRDKIDLILSAGLFAILSTGIKGIASRRTYEGTAVTLRFPLPAGTYAIINGGRGEWVNANAGVPAHAYAVEAVALGPGLRRASSLTPSSLQDYATFDRVISSPCVGMVSAVVSDLPDLPPLAPEKMDHAHEDGNFVRVQCPGAEVTIAHMKQGSAQVQRDQEIDVGAVLGRIGNSGASSEPHLHVRASRGEISVPMAFSPGGFLTRNDTLVVSPH